MDTKAVRQHLQDIGELIVRHGFSVSVGRRGCPRCFLGHSVSAQEDDESKGADLGHAYHFAQRHLARFVAPDKNQYVGFMDANLRDLGYDAPKALAAIATAIAALPDTDAAERRELYGEMANG